MYAILTRRDAYAESLDKREYTSNVRKEESDGAYGEPMPEAEEAGEGAEKNCSDREGSLRDEYWPLVLEQDAPGRLFIEERGHPSAEAVHSDAQIVQNEAHAANG